MEIFEKKKFGPQIVVMGIGGAGGNAVNSMLREKKLEYTGEVQDRHLGVEFLSCNTDQQALSSSLCSPENRIQLGFEVTKGLGAGARPEIGRIAAEVSLETVIERLDGVDMLFVTAGMGGGTGTGAAPILAKAAKDRGILTVAVVTKPFFFEGHRRMSVAEEGIIKLRESVDTLLVLPNQKLFRLAGVETSFIQAFAWADKVLRDGVDMFISLMEKPGLVNLDFADIVAILRDADGAEEEKGDAMMGTGRAGGEDRAMRAAEAAISCFLLETEHIRRAKAAMVQVSGGEDMTLTEIDGALHFIRSQIEDDASDRPQPSNIIFGATFDNTIPKGELQISVVATGIKRVEAASPKIEASHLTEVLSAEEKTGSSPLDHLEPELASSIEDFFDQKLADIPALGRRHGDFSFESERFSSFSSLREDGTEEGYGSGQEFSLKDSPPEKRVSRLKKFFSRRVEERIPYVKENIDSHGDQQDTEDLTIPAFLRKAGKGNKSDKY
ncbi:cell division protein FtsZ [Holospora curviuscula]|uniref:Cell division protein FtsZ n=1 Tax=Holospora curviuscula TaxID=1082868 RepID=A0A2S5R9L8_9PROT|nr:cell division protein FtsZ [Holospora curviuscula]PPE04014.1 Cell division protein FtsZ [Holospora curviuscula]